MTCLRVLTVYIYIYICKSSEDVLFCFICLSVRITQLINSLTLIIIVITLNKTFEKNWTVSNLRDIIIHLVSIVWILTFSGHKWNISGYKWAQCSLRILTTFYYTALFLKLEITFNNNICVVVIDFPLSEVDNNSNNVCFLRHCCHLKPLFSICYDGLQMTKRRLQMTTMPAKKHYRYNKTNVVWFHNNCC